MRCSLAILVFAAAAASASLAASGLAVVPHVDPPGTPLVHDHHVLAAYRYPLFLIQLQIRALRLDAFAVDALGAGGLGALTLALLAAAVPRLPRPTIRAVADAKRPAAPREQWRAALPTAPPREIVLQTVVA